MKLVAIDRFDREMSEVRQQLAGDRLSTVCGTSTLRSGRERRRRRLRQFLASDHPSNCSYCPTAGSPLLRGETWPAFCGPRGSAATDRTAADGGCGVYK